MINTENTDSDLNEEPKSKKEEKPDEHGGIVVQGFLRIHDPESGETLVQGRA